MARHAGTGSEGYGGHWITQLAEHVASVNEIELGIVTAYPDLREAHFSEDGVEYFVIPQPSRYPAFGMRAIDLEKCLAAIEQFKPDLIHIHGSERFYGLIKVTSTIQVPVLISIQGLLGPFSMRRHFFGTLSLFEILKSIRLIELPVRYGLAWQYYDAWKAAKREAKMLAVADGFLGRTDWDRAHAKLHNPQAEYFQVGEIMRPAFFNRKWSLNNCERHTLIYTNAGHPCRGAENLLAAVALLRKEFPDIRLRLAGTVSLRSGYGRFIRRRIKELELEDKIDFLGYINEESLVSELTRAHVFTITSYIENSPNSLAEAMLAGMPCVASFVGGIPSMIHDDETGLLYPVEDVPLLADKIRKIFLDDELAMRLGDQASRIACERHQPQLVVNQLLEAYEVVLKKPSNRRLERPVTS